MEQNNTQAAPTTKSKARCVCLGFLVVGLIVFIIGLCMANYNVSIDYTIETGELYNPTVISEMKNESEAKSGLINVKDNLSRGLKLDVDGDKLNVIEKAIITADSKATLALVAYIFAILSAVGIIVVDAVGVFAAKNNKILKVTKVVCSLLFIAAAACAVIVYTTSVNDLYYTLRDTLKIEMENNMRMVAHPYMGADIATLLGMIGAGIVIIGFIAMPLARAYKKQYNKKHNK